jgi:predicted O-linked N-acetylglucosamine transferase (SPINDLY family)
MDPAYPPAPVPEESIVKTVAKPATPSDKLQKYRRAVRANPRDARAHALLGLELQELGQLEEAVAGQRRALQLDPTLTALHETIASALHALGKHADAIDSFRRALLVQKKNAALHKGLIDALHETKQFDEAAASAERALALCPGDSALHFCLAKAQHVLTDDARGADSFRQVLTIDPDHVDARLELGRCLHRLKQYEAAEANFRHVLESRPGDPTVMNALGQTLVRLEQLEPARAVFQEALQIAPEHEQVLSSLAFACFELGHGEQAVEYARRVVELYPHKASLHSMYLFMLSHSCLDPAELTAEHRKFGERWDATAWTPHPNQPDPERRLNIGFVSADLYNHAVTNFIEPVFAVLKHSTQLTLHVYDNGTVEDDATLRLRGHVAHWHPIAGLDDDAAEQQIRADGIDILIDLSSHSLHNRLPLFGRKPAPVQVSWIGYAGTTGLKTMDYYVADPFRLPEGRYDDQFTENICRLPLVAPFMPNPGAPPVNPLPALRNGYLTFGSFHRLNKVSRKVVALWAKLLRALPDSKMVLGGITVGEREEALLGWFDEEGIDRSRLILRRRATMREYLAQHHEVDICLTPFPYTGSTTVAHALWMGVPTLCTLGATNPSHSVAFYLAHLGLGSFIADSEEIYVKLGVFLSQNLSELAALRASMRERFANSLVGYPGITAAGAEHAFRLMWQRWCAGLPSAPLRVRLSDLAISSEQESEHEDHSQP